MLEYYTGFDRAAVDLLVRRFCEVSLGPPFPPVFAVLPGRELLQWFVCVFLIVYS